MKGVKEKIKTFVNRHKTKIIVGAMLVATGITTRFVYRKAFSDGLMNGIVAGFHGTINWFDEEFEDLHLRELYNNWVAEHPEEIMYL